MTKKDYELIEKVIEAERRNWGVAHDKEVIDGLAIELAVAFKKDNPRFDYFRFIEECGIPISRV